MLITVPALAYLCFTYPDADLRHLAAIELGEAYVLESRLALGGPTVAAILLLIAIRMFRGWTAVRERAPA